MLPIPPSTDEKSFSKLKVELLRNILGQERLTALVVSSTEEDVASKLNLMVLLLRSSVTLKAGNVRFFKTFLMGFRN